MQTQIKTYIQTSKGLKFITIFGYATRGVPGVQINGAGRLSKNIKEKIIYLTRNKNIKLSTKRYVICLDISDCSESLGVEELKSIELPILLIFWYLAGILPMKKLDNCLCSGWFTTQGIIYQSPYPFGLDKYLPVDLTPVEFKSLKHITFIDGESGFQKIDSRLLLEHLSDLKFRIDYIERDSAIPIKSIRA